MCFVQHYAVWRFISEAMYNFYNIFSMGGVSTIVPGFAARAQGSKVDIDGEVYDESVIYENLTPSA